MARRLRTRKWRWRSGKPRRHEYDQQDDQDVETTVHGLNPYSREIYVGKGSLATPDDDEAFRCAQAPRAAMAVPTGIRPDDDVALAAQLAPLGSPVRLALLRALRRPVPLGRIGVNVEEDKRRLSRQGVTWHLDQLLEAGLVRRLPGDGRSHLYVLDHQRLFAVIDALHDLTRIRPSAAVLDPESTTIDARDDGKPGAPAMARLVVVYGRDDGAVHPVAGEPGTRWVLGRDAGCDVPLDYDPFASARHAVVEQMPDGHRLVDLQSSNGTRVNGERLRPGGARILVPGDILTVGRTRLVFQA